MKYIVPEYYKHFECKCGNCRHSCCDGWPIRISMKEYYNLLGIKCSGKLRSRLDCALKLVTEPGSEGYAQISADWRGICMMHREDGLCSLQVSLGERNLPEVCRLYPRNTRQLSENNTCSCSNSCEAVVELLISLKKPLVFEEIELPVVPIFEANLLSVRNDFCNSSISILQERSKPLSDRLIILGHHLSATDTQLSRPNQLSLALRMLHLLDLYYSDSLSVQDYCKAALCYYCIEDKEELSAADMDILTQKYNAALELLDTTLPDWQIFFEQLLVNHMFYNNFPYYDDQENVRDSFLSFAITYSFLRFNLLGNLSALTTQEELVDLLSAMFRLIEHSNFRHTAVSLLKKENYPLPEGLSELLFL